MINFSVAREAALTSVTTVENILILDYLKDAPGDFVKVYVYALMQLQNPALANNDIMTALNMSDKDIIEAFSYWQKRGVIRIVSGDPMHIEFLNLKPSLTQSMYEGTKYDKLLEALIEVMGGRIFTTPELKFVYDWVEIFGLNEDVVVKLVAYCMDLKGRSVSIKYIDLIAKTWADMHIYTTQDADEYISEQSAYAGRVKDIKKRWRLSRNITEDELALYKKWCNEWGISHEVIMDACAQAIYASSPTFAYLDKVLEGYRERGTVDLATIEAYRKKRIKSDEFARELFLSAGLKQKPTVQQRDRVETWLYDWRISEEALKLLSERASNYSRPFEYMSRIVASWNERDIRNLEAAKNDLAASGSHKKSEKHFSPKANYPQRKYTKEDLIKLGINLSGD